MATPYGEEYVRFSRIYAPLRYRSIATKLQIDAYERLPCVPERAVDYEGPLFYRVFDILDDAGLQSLWNYGNLLPFYPSLVAEFYGNMISSVNNGIRTVQTAVLGVQIDLTSSVLSAVMGVPVTHLDPLPTSMPDQSIIAKLSANLHVNMSSSALHPAPHIVHKILVHNLFQKSGSLSYVNKKLQHALYAIFSTNNVNWGSVALELLAKPVENQLLLPCLITRIMRAFDVPYSDLGEGRVSPIKIDLRSLTLMGIPPSVYNVDPYPEESTDIPADAPTPPPSAPPTRPTTAATPGSSGVKHKKVLASKTTDASTSRTPNKPTMADMLDSISAEIGRVSADLGRLRHEVNEGLSGIQTHFSSYETTLNNQTRLLMELQASHAQILSMLGRGSRSPGSTSSPGRSPSGRGRAANP